MATATGSGSRAPPPLVAPLASRGALLLRAQPDEPKFRKIRLSNPKIAASVCDISPAALRLLALCGARPSPLARRPSPLALSSSHPRFLACSPPSRRPHVPGFESAGDDESVQMPDAAASDAPRLAEAVVLLQAWAELPPGSPPSPV